MPKTQQTQLLNVNEAAAALLLKPASLYQKIWRREIEFVRIGRNVRFRADEIERLIQEGVVPPLETR